MSAFGLEGFASVEEVEVEIYTDAYRIAGTVHTPFRRVAEILNQLTGAHLHVDGATVIAHGAPDEPERMSSGLVAVDEVLALIATGLGGEPRAEMMIRKQQARARLSIPPLHLEGTIHVPVESRVIDGLLNVPDRFLPMTDAVIRSAAYPELDREAPILALRRDRAHVITILETPEARPDEEPDAAEEQPEPAAEDEATTEA